MSHRYAARTIGCASVKALSLAHDAELLGKVTRASLGLARTLLCPGPMTPTISWRAATFLPLALLVQACVARGRVTAPAANAKKSLTSRELTECRRRASVGPPRSLRDEDIVEETVPLPSPAYGETWWTYALGLCGRVACVAVDAVTLTAQDEWGRIASALIALGGCVDLPLPSETAVEILYVVGTDAVVLASNVRLPSSVRASADMATNSIVISGEESAARAAWVDMAKRDCEALAARSAAMPR